jgi:hypothetical protein
MPQQPSVTITGQISLSGPRAFGDCNARLGEFALPFANPALLLVTVGARRVLLLTDPFLLFLVLGIASTHLYIFFCIQICAKNRLPC